jgi:hypothetical protein
LIRGAGWRISPSARAFYGGDALVPTDRRATQPLSGRVIQYRPSYAGLIAAAGSGIGKSQTKRSTAAMSPSIVIFPERCASASGRPPRAPRRACRVGVNRCVGLIGATAGDLDLIVFDLDPKAIFAESQFVAGA